MTYTNTNKFYYEVSELEDNETTIDECKWQLISKESDENLCDFKSDNECVGNTYFTDDSWAITHYCTKHFNNQVADGIFKEV